MPEIGYENKTVRSSFVKFLVDLDKSLHLCILLSGKSLKDELTFSSVIIDYLICNERKFVSLLIGGLTGVMNELEKL